MRRSHAKEAKPTSRKETMFPPLVPLWRSRGGLTTDQPLNETCGAVFARGQPFSQQAANTRAYCAHVVRRMAPGTSLLRHRRPRQ